MQLFLLPSLCRLKTMNDTRCQPLNQQYRIRSIKVSNIHKKKRATCFRNSFMFPSIRQIAFSLQHSPTPRRLSTMISRHKNGGQRSTHMETTYYSAPTGTTVSVTVWEPAGFTVGLVIFFDPSGMIVSVVVTVPGSYACGSG